MGYRVAVVLDLSVVNLLLTAPLAPGSVSPVVPVGVEVRWNFREDRAMVFEFLLLLLGVHLGDDEGVVLTLQGRILQAGVLAAAHGSPHLQFPELHWERFGVGVGDDRGEDLPLRNVVNLNLMAVVADLHDPPEAVPGITKQTGLGG